VASERLVVWHRWLPPKREAPEDHPRVARWRRSVAARFQVTGGTVLGALGATVAAAFDPQDVADVVEMALELVEEAEELALEVALGLAAGAVDEGEDGGLGAALERAQLLANRARPGEVVLDPACRELAAEEFLFGRQVAAGAGAARGTTVDRKHPRRVDCADAIAELGPTALPPVVDSVRAEVEDEIERGQGRTFVLRGPVGAGTTELLRALERGAGQARSWTVGAAPGGIVPLASLRHALLRRLGSPAAVREAFADDGRAAGPAAVLARVAAGELVPLDELSSALGALLRAERDGGRRPWVVLSPLSLVDGASLAAMLEVRARGGDFVLFGRYPVENVLPRPLLELDEPVRELTLPPLKMADARVVAEAVLGADAPEDVTRRVAVLGGDTVLGIVEAARTLIANGDLVREAERFVWRTSPRGGAHAIGTEALLAERLELLDGESRRVLEALCVVPDGSSRALLAEVVGHDGVSPARLARSFELLHREALARGRERPRPISSLLRWRVLSLIPPARAMELHRFVGESLRARLEAEPARGDRVPLRVELGYYLLEGGREAEGRPLLSDALEPLVRAGYERAARQLSGWLSALDERAIAGGDRATPQPPPLEALEEPPPSSELALDEMLDEEDEVDVPAPRSAPPPPPRPATPPPPPRPATPPPPPRPATPPPPPRPATPPPPPRPATPPPPAVAADGEPAATVAEAPPAPSEPPPAPSEPRPGPSEPPPVPRVGAARAPHEAHGPHAPHEPHGPHAPIEPHQAHAPIEAHEAHEHEPHQAHAREPHQAHKPIEPHEPHEHQAHAPIEAHEAHEHEPHQAHAPIEPHEPHEPHEHEAHAPIEAHEAHEHEPHQAHAPIGAHQPRDREPHEHEAHEHAADDGDLDALGDEVELDALEPPTLVGEVRAASAAPPAAEPPEDLDEAVDALLSEPPPGPDERTSTAGSAPPGALEPPPAAEPEEAAALDASLDELLGPPRADDGDAPLEELAPERTSVSAAPMRPFVEEAVRAIRRRDFDELERAIQRAIADGSDLGAVHRIRAVAELARGDLEAARRSLRGAQERGRGDRAARARYRLAEALLDLHAGEPVAGIRAGLSALAASRALGDARGETAALHTLAACYRALGRERDAARLEAAR
jgi:hypothetical protein